MLCDKCESEIVGARCVCGWEAPGVLAVRPMIKKLRWHLCEWIAGPGRTCQVPTGVERSESERGVIHAPKLCAYHQHRARIATFGQFMSEEAIFEEWIEQFPPGTTYQPTPGIWGGDRAQLLALVSGLIGWDEFQRTLSAVEGV